VWRRRGEAASAGLSAAPYSAHHGLYSEAVVSSAVALAEVGQFKEAVQYVQRATKALYEAAKEAFERVKVTVQRLVELFVEAVERALALIHEHRAYLFLMAAAAAGAVALNIALNMWGLVELEKLAYAASAAPCVAGLADAGGKAAERFKTLAEWYEKWKDENVINEVINAPLNKERPFLKLAESGNLPKPLAELRRALKDVKDETLAEELVREAIARGWVDVKKAESWLEKLESDLTLEEGWPKYYVGLARSGALRVIFGSTSPDNIEEEAHRLGEMGLEEGVHFSVKMPEGGGKGYVWILKEGLSYAAWLSVHGSGSQRELAAEFVKYILQRAERAGNDVCEKVKKIIEEGKARDPDAKGL
jgi:tetratricopeptide (TPR) repeat protein